MRWLGVALLLAPLLALSRVAPAHAQQDYRLEIEQALGRLRAQVFDMSAWHQLNAAVRAALAVDDLETAAPAIAEARELVVRLTEELGGGLLSEGEIATLPEPDATIHRAMHAVMQAIDEMLDALASERRDAARTAVARGQEAAQKGVDAAILKVQSLRQGPEVAVGAPPPAPQVAPLLQAAAAAAAVGLEPQVVEATFLDIRELLLAQALPAAATLAACGGPAATPLVTVALGLGADEPTVQALIAPRPCPLQLDGTVNAEYLLGYDTAAFRTALSGTVSVSVAVTAAGTVEGNGTLTLTATLTASGPDIQCAGSGSGSVPVRVSGEAVGGRLRLFLVPTGAVDVPVTCTVTRVSLPRDAFSFPIPVTVPANTAPLEMEAAPGAQARLVEAIPAFAERGAGTVTWELRLTARR